MSTAASSGARWRNKPVDRGSPSTSPGPIAVKARPKSSIFPSPPTNPPGHNRNQSFSPSNGPSFAPLQATRQRSNSNRTCNQSNQSSNTFAPQFITAEESQRAGERIGGIEGENDFSGKRYVWLRDSQLAFVKGWVVEELGGSRLLVQCEDGSV